MTSARPSRPKTPTPVLAYVTAVVCAAVAGAVLVASSTPPIAASVPIVAVALAAAMAEWLRTTIEFRGEKLEITLVHLPLAFGLLLVPRGPLLLAMGAGVAAIRLVALRQPPVKFAFNLSSSVLDAVIAIAVFDLIADADRFAPRDWIAVAVALGVADLVSALIVTGVIAAATRRWTLTPLSVVLGVVMSATLGSVALAAAAAYRADARTVILFVVPCGIVYLAFIAFERQRVQKEQIELLYRITRSWTEEAALDRRLETFLGQCVDGLLAERIELFVCSAEDRSFRFRASADEFDRHVSTDPLPEALARALGEALVGPADATTTDAASRDGEDLAIATRLGIERGIAAPLLGTDGAPFGLLLLGDRDSSEGWQASHVQLVQALAELLAPIVASDEQSSTIAELRTLRDDLHFQANHDQLTGLANRALFLHRLGEAIRPTTTCAVLYIDLDGFKPVNDRLGHAAGDELLRAVAGRLETLGGAGLVARLGGDEFAILLDRADAVDVPDLAHRIVDQLGTPFGLGSTRVGIGASVGATTSRPDDTTGSIVRRADGAMYEAKRAGRSRYVVVAADATSADETGAGPDRRDAGATWGGRDDTATPIATTP